MVEAVEDDLNEEIDEEVLDIEVPAKTELEEPVDA